MDILVFGDQTVQAHALLRKVFLKQGRPLLRSFLQETQCVLADEISKLVYDRRVRIPYFSTLRELVDRYYKAGVRDASLESALMCLAQLAHFIGFFEDNPRTYVKSGDHILGMCTGLLAATAVASSQSLTALIPLAVQAVRIAFRVGAVVSTKADILEKVTEGQTSWATIVTGVGPDALTAELDRFNHEQCLSTTQKVYISSSSSTAATVSGPPTIRSRFFRQHGVLASSPHRDLPVYGPYHAPHLFSGIRGIIPEDVASFFNLYSPVNSVSGLKTPDGASCLQLFEEAIRQILGGLLCWDVLAADCFSAVQESDPPTCRILSMGPTALGDTLASSLKTASNGLTLTLEDHVSWLQGNTIPSNIRGDLAGCNIAITGMAGRFPDAADHELFWELLSKGLDVHRQVPPDRFDAQKHTDPSEKGRNKSHTPYGCFIEQPGLFDPRFFNMSPREATQTDPMQRLAITTAYEAMESSGFVMNRTPSTQAGRIGTFYGQTSDDWREINAAQDIDTYFITGGVRAFGPGRINYHYGFSGPSFSIDTACSSSFAAIQLACTSLRAGDCDTVFAGGMNVLTNPDIFAGLSKGQFLSKTGSCKTFDQGADGYCRGDGVATIILKRVEDAIADNDPILAVIRGAATNHSAEAISITHPHADTQKFLFQKIMDDVGVDVRDVSYVEMHGTGTQAGDGVEMESVSSIFAPQQNPRRAEQPLYVGSTKANIGHGEAVSGVSSLIKVMLMFQKNLIPPHCGIKGHINETFPKDLKERGVNIAFRPTPYPRPANNKRYVFINNFSAAGGNSGLLVEDAPLRSIQKRDPRSTHVVAITAKSLASFRKNLANLLSWVEKNPSESLPSLAYTTTARRNHFQYRVSFSTDSMDSFRSTLSSFVGADMPHKPVASKPPNVVFAFTGQGSQYTGMAKELFAVSKYFKKQIQSFDEIVQSEGFPSIIGLIDGSIDINSASPVAVQLAIPCIQMALARLWESWGIVPTAVIGHSLGEYAALHIAGVLSAFDVIHLVGTRAQLLASSCAPRTHAMLAIKGNFSGAEHFLNSIPVEVACVNSPQDTVLSGPMNAIDSAKGAFTGQNFKCTKLDLPFAFHSAQVDPILDSFEASARTVVFNTPKLSILSPVISGVIKQAGIIGPQYLRRHCREKVDFLGSLVAGLQDGVIDQKTVWVEIGPHPLCLNMIKATLGSDVVRVPSLNKTEDAWKTLSNTLSTLYCAGLNLNWSECHRDFESSLDVVSAPTYAFDNKTYWLDYRNHWTLTKGDVVEVKESAPTKPSFSTTSIQKIVQEELQKNTAIVVAESDLHEPLLKAAVSGHLVNNAPLCPSSLYADMALTICGYAYKLVRPDSEEPGINVCNMESHSPLVLDTKSTSQILRIATTVDVDRNSAEVTFQTVSSTGNKEHAKCLVLFESPAKWMAEFKRSAHLVGSRIETLKTGPGVHTIYRGMAYKLFAALVNYQPKYRGMEEVYLNSENLEATSNVSFQANAEDGNFVMSPYFIDSVAHISGFIMNANDAVDSSTQVYISHGWETMRFAERLEADKKYRSYVKMSTVNEASKMVAGDVYILRGDNIIGIVGGLKFQCVPRRLLETLLGPKKKPSATTTSPSKANGTIPATKKSAQVNKREKQPPVQKSQPRVTSRPSSLISRALDIIAAEVGCSLTELDDNILFTDLGVDSLMSLSITGRFREELEVNVSGALFVEFTTVGQLKGYLAPFGTPNIEIDQQDELSDLRTKVNTPDTTFTDDPIASGQLEEAMNEIDDNDNLIATIRATIAGEMGVNIEEIADTTDLSAMGMDSLMTLTILGSLKEETGVSFSSDFFVANNNLEEIGKSLGLRKKKPTRSVMPTTLDVPTPIKHISAPTPTWNISAPREIQIVLPPTPPVYPPAQCFLLQGSPKTATHNVFLLPDGSGSSASYANIPDLDDTTAVFGLNCPFMRTPEQFTIGVHGVIPLYMEAIKKRQPQGPYILGGWSAGGVFAYEMARRLVAQGETVSKLILIDSPFPINLEALPPVFHQYCKRIGLLGEGVKTPDWLLPHFAATVRELTRYSESLAELPEIDTKNMPPTTVIWARDGLVPKNDPGPEWDPSVPMPNSMFWLSYDRTDFGHNGWEDLVGVGNVRCMSMPGNHFSMIRDPLATELGRLIKQALID